MLRRFAGSAFVMCLSLTVSMADGAPRRGGGGGAGAGGGARSAGGGGRPAGGPTAGGPAAGAARPAGAAPGAGRPAGGPAGTASGQVALGAAGGAGSPWAGKKSPGGAWSAFGAGGAPGAAALGARGSASGTGAGAFGAAAVHQNNQAGASVANPAAAGAAVADRNQPGASTAGDAAFGAAAANRNAPDATGAEGAAAGAAYANRNSPDANYAAAGGYAAVHNNFNHPDLYETQWYGAHTDAWAASGWAAGAAWTRPTAAAVAYHCGYAGSSAINYNYGTNVTCVDGNVLVDGQPAGTAEEFSQQASDLANVGVMAQPLPDDKWLPLGVFALVRDEQQHPQLILQLAINQQGIIRGNYTDEVTDSTLPIRGAVDQRTQRAAWVVGDNAYSVMEAGLSNLLENEAPALLHKGGQTQHWLLVRLQQPPASSEPGTPAAQ